MQDMKKRTQNSEKNFPVPASPNEAGFFYAQALEQNDEPTMGGLGL